MKTDNSLRFVPYALALLAAGMYIAACLLPALDTYQPGYEGRQYGWELLVWGWIRANQTLGWFANPFLFAAWLLILFKRPRAALFTSGAVIVFGLTTFGLHEYESISFVASERVLVTGYGAGFYLWFGALVLTALAAICGVIVQNHLERDPFRQGLLLAFGVLLIVAFGAFWFGNQSASQQFQRIAVSRTQDAVKQTQLAGERTRTAAARTAAAPTPLPSRTRIATLPPVAVTATAQAARIATPAIPQWKVVFSDSFDRVANDWSNHSSRSIANGKYTWKFESSFSFQQMDVPKMDWVSDSVVSLEGKQVSGMPTIFYGVFVRYDGAGYYYTFTVRDDGAYRFGKVVKGMSQDLASGTTVAIKPGEVNKLTVLAQADNFRLFINDQYIAQVNDDESLTGSTGLVVELLKVGDEGVIEFDNFEVRAP